MGEKVSYNQMERAKLGVVLLVLGVLWVGVGVVSASPARPTATGPSPQEILSVDLREGAPGYFVDVTTSGPVAWTTFRDADDNVVVEMPNSIPALGLSDRFAGDGPVASVDLVEEQRSNRPVTLLRIATRERVEHTLEAHGDRLEVRLLPVAPPERPSFSYEPLPMEADPAAAPPAQVAQAPQAPPEPEPAFDEPLAEPEPMGEAGDELAALDAATAMPQPPASEPPPQTGTADDPVVAPPPSGVPATRLAAVEVQSAEPATVVRIVGDGEFRYSYFSLDNPPRFVVDLDGVVNETSRTAVPVGGGVVEQVRVAQFKPYPDPVSRVVFDLGTDAVPRIQSDGTGLTVRFGDAGPAASADLVEPDEPVARGDVTAEMEPGDLDMEGPEADELEAEPTLEETGPESQIEVETARPGGDVTATVEPEPAMERPQRVPEVAPASREMELFAEDDMAIRQEEPTSELGDQFSVRSIGGGETQYVGEPIDMSVRDADVVEVLRMFAQISGLNVVIQPGVSGTVTVELKNVPWDQALDQVLKINGLGFELEGNIMRVAPTEVLASEAEQRQRLERAKALSQPLSTIMRRLSYAGAGNVAQLLQTGGGLLSQRGSVIVDQRTNTLIIKELPEFLGTINSVIELLDTPEPQVMIEARIVETTKRFNRTLGIAWGFTGEASAELGTTTGLEFPNNVNTDGSVNLLTGGNNGIINLALGNVLNSFNLDATLQAAESEGLINILSAPKVATLNNEQASIQSGLQIPVQTVANNTVTVQFVNATLELQVTPQVTAEGTILMDINIAKREPQLAFAVQGAQNAPISTKEARTRVIVRDGGTTVIGGIYEVSTDQGQDRVPGLAKIPILGHLFRNKRRTDENEELLIFITPRVINL